MINLDSLKSTLTEAPNKRERIIFFATIFVFFLVFLRSCWVPSRLAISTLKDEIKGAEAEKSALLVASKNSSAAAGEKVAAAAKGLVGVPIQYNEWAARLSTNPDSVMILEFSNPAIVRNVVLSDVQFLDSGTKFKGEGVFGRGFKLSLLGPFMSVGSYLERLEDLPILLNIDSISLNSIEGQNGRVTAEISGTAYGWK